MPEVAIATTSPLAADAGARIAERGGNAVDAAIAAALVSVVTEPGVCSLGAGGFLTIWPSVGEPLTVDGYVEMPGRGLPRERFGGGRRDIYLEYGGGVSMTVGHGSVATPGVVAAFGLASERFGSLPWRELVEPAYESARDGFPLPQASYNYLIYAHDLVFGWNPQSRRALHDESGRLREAGETIHIEGLAESLRAIAERGPDELYRGRLARLIAEDVTGNGGILTSEDLAAYRAVERPALTVELDGWRVATNPPPAVGGCTLAAMLLLMGGRPASGWTAAELSHLVAVQRAVLAYRRRHLDVSENLPRDAHRLLDLAAGGSLERFAASPSTVHTSAVDSSGLACAVTVSAGYGSGVMPPGTGIWMNNCLGEVELNRRGYHALEPGTRLPSNMAPTVARRGTGAVLAIGSPGADRITTAILQVMLNFTRLGMSLEEAVSHPRVHVEAPDAGGRVAYEAGLSIEEGELPLRRYEEPSMFFGGVGAALWDPARGFELAADPRRVGGTAVGGKP